MLAVRQDGCHGCVLREYGDKCDNIFITKNKFYKKAMLQNFNSSVTYDLWFEYCNLQIEFTPLKICIRLFNASTR